MPKYKVNLVVEAEDLVSLIKYIEDIFPGYISVDVSNAD